MGSLSGYGLARDLFDSSQVRELTNYMIVGPPLKPVDIRRSECFPSAFDRVTREPVLWSVWFTRGPTCSDEDWAAFADVAEDVKHGTPG